MGMGMHMIMDMDMHMDIDMEMQLDMHMDNDARPCLAGLCHYRSPCAPLCRAATCSRGSGAGCSTGKPPFAVLPGVKKWLPA